MAGSSSRSRPTTRARQRQLALHGQQAPATPARAPQQPPHSSPPRLGPRCHLGTRRASFAPSSTSPPRPHVQATPSATTESTQGSRAPSTGERASLAPALPRFEKARRRVSRSLAGSSRPSRRAFDQYRRARRPYDRRTCGGDNRKPRPRLDPSSTRRPFLPPSLLALALTRPIHRDASAPCSPGCAPPPRPSRSRARSTLGAASPTAAGRPSRAPPRRATPRARA